MSWRDSLRPGSFRGATFEVESAGQDGGRRTVVHEFAQRDDVFVEDMGLGPREFRVDGLVIGDDYMAARDALITAAEASGPGILVHPYRGSLTVSCQRYSVRESSDQGGAAFFSLVFIASAVAVQAAEVEDTTASAEAAAVATAVEAEAGFASRFSVAGLPGFVAEGAAEQVAALGERLQSGVSRLRGARDALSGATLRIETLRADALGLVRRVPNLASTVTGLIASIRLLADTPRAAIGELRGLIGYTPSFQPWSPTPARNVQRANGDALGRLVTLAASAEAVKAATELTFESYDEAVAVRDDLADRIDEAAAILADAGDDAGFERLNILRLALVRDVTQRGGSLARIYRYTPPATEPALVTAHRLYGDAGRAAEIVDRNAVRHPGFLAGGAVLEVLTDG